ncbi:MAG TPA: hypothetical protein H9815_11480 [Candidatus Ruania gallistercoris]|uniref:DUF732 domain-containing protein n=1 Tax=Candidatus Ruania gallistercoris TaxID=2838746 RepID=A0A9D2EFH0_9MICO|nr:hypothetical protein [Candidatus Ruania gallistercoris]
MKTSSRLCYLLGAGLLLLAACSAGEYQPTAEDKDNYVVGYGRAMLAAADASGTTVDEGATPELLLEALSPSEQDGLVQGGLDVCEALRTEDADDLRQRRVIHDETSSVALGGVAVSFEDQAILAVRHLCPDAEERFEQVRAEL